MFESICGSLPSGSSFRSSAVSLPFVGASGDLESEFSSSLDSSACSVPGDFSFSARDSEVLSSLPSKFSIALLVPKGLSLTAECA